MWEEKQRPEKDPMPPSMSTWPFCLTLKTRYTRLQMYVRVLKREKDAACVCTLRRRKFSFAPTLPPPSFALSFCSMFSNYSTLQAHPPSSTSSIAFTGLLAIAAPSMSETHLGLCSTNCATASGYGNACARQVAGGVITCYGTDLKGARQRPHHNAQHNFSTSLS